MVIITSTNPDLRNLTFYVITCIVTANRHFIIVLLITVDTNYCIIYWIMWPPPTTCMTFLNAYGEFYENKEFIILLSHVGRWLRVQLNFSPHVDHAQPQANRTELDLITIQKFFPPEQCGYALPCIN